MQILKKILDVPGRAAWSVALFALFGMAVLAATGKELTWPNPWRSQPEQHGPKAKVIEEEVLTKTLDKLDESLDKELEELALKPGASIESTVLVQPPTQPSQIAATPPSSAELMDAALSWLEAQLNDDAELATAGEPVGAQAASEAAKVAQFTDALDNIPAIQENCRLGSGEKCKLRGLDAFFQRLDMVQMGQKVKMAVYGDSLIMGDQVVGHFRRRLQEKFGNGGPGFFMPAKPARWYGVAGAVVYGSNGWKINRVTEPHVADKLYGYGAQSFLAAAANEDSHIECDSRCPWNDITDYEVYYLAQKGGGSFSLKAGKNEAVEVATQGGQSASAYYSVKTEAGPLNVEIISKSGPVRLFGVSAENSKPGIVLDSMGILGATAVSMNETSPDHFAEQIRHRNPDLAILFFGTNESEGGAINGASYKKGYAKLIETIRKGNPNISILIVSPPARGQKGASGVTLKPNIEMLVTLQKEIAAETGCAYWSMFDAMGGKAGPELWFAHKPPYIGNDLTHFTNEGATHMGKLLYAALAKSYLEYRKR